MNCCFQTSRMGRMNHEEVYLLMNEFQGLPLEHVFSPKFTGQRAQIISHDHTHHLECSDCHYQTFVTCVPLLTKHFSSVQCSLSSIFRAQTIVQVAVKNTGMLVLRCTEPKGTVPFGKCHAGKNLGVQYL